MTWVIIKIEHHSTTDDAIHKFRNFGESVWAHFRDDRKVRIDIGEIDRATNVFEFSVRKRYDRRIDKTLQKFLKDHMLLDEVTVSVLENRP